jgi:hypothetical protein
MNKFSFNTTVKGNIELYEEIEKLEKERQKILKTFEDSMKDYESEMENNKSNIENLNKLRELQTNKIRSEKSNNEAKLGKIESQIVIVGNEINGLKKRISKKGAFVNLENEICFYENRLKLLDKKWNIVNRKRLELAEAINLSNSEIEKSNKDIKLLKANVETFEKNLETFTDAPIIYDHQYKAIDKFKVLELLIEKLATDNKLKLFSDLGLKILKVNNLTELFTNFANEFISIVDHTNIVNVMKIAINLLYCEKIIHFRTENCNRNVIKIQELNEVDNKYMEKLRNIEKRKGSYERIRNTLVKTKVDLMKKAGVNNIDIGRLSELEIELNNLKLEELKLRNLITKIPCDDNIQKEIDINKEQNEKVRNVIKQEKDKINETVRKLDEEILKLKLNVNENNCYLKNCIQSKPDEVESISDKQLLKINKNIWASKIEKLRGTKLVSRLEHVDNVYISDDEIKNNLINESVSSDKCNTSFMLEHDVTNKKLMFNSSLKCNATNKSDSHCSYLFETNKAKNSDSHSDNIFSNRIFSFGNINSEENGINDENNGLNSRISEGKTVIQNKKLNIKDLQYQEMTPDQVILIYNKGEKKDYMNVINSIKPTVESDCIKPKEVRSYIPKREVIYNHSTKSYDIPSRDKLYDGCDNTMKRPDNDTFYVDKDDFKPLSLKFGNRDNLSDYTKTERLKNTNRNKSLYSDKNTEIDVFAKSSFMKETRRSSPDISGNSNTKIKSHDIPLSLKDTDSGRITKTNSIGFKHDNSSRQEFLLAEKLYPLLEGIKVYERNILLSRAFEEYSVLYKNKYQSPEEHNFKQYFCYVDREMKKLLLNNVNRDDKNREIYLTSIKRLGVPLVTKNLVFLIQVYKKIKTEGIPESQIVSYLKSKGSEKYKRLFNATIDINLFDEEYRDGLLKSNVFMVYIYLKEDARLELIFDDYGDYKHWINGLEEIRTKASGKTLEIIRKKIV